MNTNNTREMVIAAIDIYDSYAFLQSEYNAEVDKLTTQICELQDNNPFLNLDATMLANMMDIATESGMDIMDVISQELAKRSETQDNKPVAEVELNTTTTASSEPKDEITISRAEFNQMRDALSDSFFALSDAIILANNYQQTKHATNCLTAKNLCANAFNRLTEIDFTIQPS